MQHQPLHRISPSRFPRARLLALALVLPLLGAGIVQRAHAAPVSFNRDIRPILSDNCFACHGFDARKRKAGLRLDVPEGATAPNKEGRVAVRPGKPDDSALWKRITSTDPDELMPPPDSHKKLTGEQKELLRRWISEGGVYQKHWAFEPPVKADPSAPRSARASAHPIDRFIRARLDREGLPASREADRETLIRRLSFTLRGLPPTPPEVDAFLGDTGEGAYERLVDRFLDSPHYGEEMARHWLDVARYADTHGMHLDNERSMWPYRDWVVKAFNHNLPFDEFTVEQLAGDLLPHPTQDQLVATGFNRCNVTTGEGGSIDAELLFRYAVDRTSTTIQTWMGLTGGCAVCHDHKYDPLTMREFYSLYAFFYSAADPAMDGNVLLTPPFLKLRTGADDSQVASFDSRIAELEARIGERVESASYTDPAGQLPPPRPRDVEEVWMGDDFPPGGRLQATGPAITWVAAKGGQVHSGKRAIRREATGLAQDVYENDGNPFEVPLSGRIHLHVFLDPAHPPRTLMIQFKQGEWRHRAVWGDIDAIEWGAKGTPERALAGPLPKTGEWVRLEFDAATVGLKPGDKLNGLALTQFDGIVYWDDVGITGTVDPARDPRHSLQVWLDQNQGKDPAGLPEPLRKVLKEVPPAQRSPAQVADLRRYYLSHACADLKGMFQPLLTEQAEVRRKREEFENRIPGTFIFRDMEKPRDSFVMVRGQYDKPGDKVTPGVPAIFPPLQTERRPTRLDLARWLVSDEHPLVARVTVNRFWQQVFGTGLVASSDNFGSQGEMPSHPELLDWLAVSFRESGWDVKRLMRLMVTSAAYRQSSRLTAPLLQRDPANRLLARGPRFRLDAEQIRDNALFVGGLIDLTPGGKGVRTYQPPNLWEPVGFVGSNTREYKRDSGNALYRRSLYTFFKRTAPPPFMSTFDAPNREQFCTRRQRSDTPLQALQLLNDVQHFEAARGFAQRMLTEGGPTARDRIRFAYRTLLSRWPATEEVRIVEEALEQHRARYAADPEAARKAVAFGESSPRSDLPPVELAAYTLTANLLLNLDETLNRN